MKYAIGIVAHPARIDDARDLFSSVNADVMVVDEDSRGEQWCHQETLEKLVLGFPEAEWYVLLEDDSIPCVNFNQKLHEYLSSTDPALISLYLGQKSWAGARGKDHNRYVEQLIKRADDRGWKFITAEGPWHAVGLAFHESYAEDALEFLRKHSGIPTDNALGKFSSLIHMPVKYVWPSLIDHRDGQSIVRDKSTEGRKAYRVEGN